MSEKTVKVKLLKAKVIDGSVEPAGSVVSVAESVAKTWIAAKEAAPEKEATPNA